MMSRATGNLVLRKSPSNVVTPFYDIVHEDHPGACLARVFERECDVEDATMFAAAPDLLAALQHILDGALALPRFAEIEGRAAVAKALGK